MWLAVRSVVAGFLIGPFIEGSAHYVLHTSLLPFARAAHRHHHVHPRWERWVLVAATISYLCGFWMVLGGLLRYGIIHHLIHDDSAMLPASLKQHHMDHHTEGKANWCVSSTWF